MSLGDESSSGDTTDLGEEEGACLCSTHDQVWETTGVDTGGETVQGALYPKQGLGGAGAKRRKVAVKPGSVGAWVTKVGGPEVAARLTGHQGWGLQGGEGEIGSSPPPRAAPPPSCPPAPLPARPARPTRSA